MPDEGDYGKRVHLSAKVYPHVKKGISESGMSFGEWIEEQYALRNSVQDQITLLEVKKQRARKEIAQYEAALAELEEVKIISENREWQDEYNNYKETVITKGLPLSTKVEQRLCTKFNCTRDELYMMFEKEARVRGHD